MAFAVGDRLGRFELLGLLGAGGMGEVYRAHDPQLQRQVAIKVLPAEFTADVTRQRRFEQEARAAAGLNHPNILGVYDVGVEGALTYIVAELLEGETLSDRIAGRPLPPRKAVEYALQTASGLAAAHDHAIVHRDLKPSNLFVTKDGRIKILDFGLAKFVGPDSSGRTETITLDDVPRAPVLGSVGYMSPEQVRGHRVDHRTDIFSFGVVLYEMLAGFPPFRRASAGETLNATLYDDPPPLRSDDAAVQGLDPLVRHCLEKSPDERFQNIRDLIFDLQSRSHDAGREARVPQRPRRYTALWRAVGAVAALVAAAAAGALLAMQRRDLAPAPVVRVRSLTNLAGLEEASAVSPDGRMVAFTIVEGERRQIYIRYLSDGPIRAVTSDAADHDAPRWLPDGASLIYFSPAGPGEVQGTLFRVPALGGPPQRLLPSIGGGDVSRESRIVSFRLVGDRVQLVSAAVDGAEVHVIADLAIQHYGYPRWSPDGRWVAFQAGDGFRWEIYAVRADGRSPPTQITNDAKVIKGLTWLPDSSGIIYSSARGSTFPYVPPMSLWEVRLDRRQRQVSSPEASYEQPDFHASGLLSVTRVRMRHDIWQYALDGLATEVDQGRQITRQTGQVSTPTPSADGSEVAYLSDNGGHSNVWVVASDRSTRQITFENDPDVTIGVPAWSPDGQWIAYLSSRGNGGLVFGIWLVKPDASDNHQLVAKGLSPTWSADGKWIYYVETSNTPVRRIPVGGGAPEVLQIEPARNVVGVHGSTVYYVVDRALMDGRQQFELRAADLNGGPARVISTIPVSRVPPWQVINPSLSPDGRSLAMPLTDGFTTNLWAISTTDAAMHQVTSFGDRPVFIARRVSWSPDGRSLLAPIGEGDADIVLLEGLVQSGSR
jgi:Tol biopolymer transport system component